MAIKAKDLAKQIGVSEATLSLVINGKPGISAKTRSRVEEQIRSLGYSHMLREDSAPTIDSATRTLSFVLYKDNGKLLGANSFFPLILDGIETTARKNGYTVNIINIEKNLVDQQISYIQDSACAGFVIFATELHHEDIARFDSLSIPYVIFDNYFNDLDINSVKVNNEQGTYLAVRHLYNMGHRKIGYLSSGLDINSFHERQRSALEAMRYFGLEECEQYVFTVGYANENAETGMDEIFRRFSKEELPTAFLADNDLVSIGAMQSAKKNGYRIPDDFSFIGYDDRPICTLVEPKLSTIQLPRERFGAEAVKILIELIEERKDSYVTVQINGKLIRRDSVKQII